MERNYDVGNWELLTVKLALEEWRHWLEGADQLEMFLFCKATQLLTSQVGPVFGRFSFTLTYHPGSRHIKLDALSHQFSTEESNTDSEPILPPTCFVAAITWEIEWLVRRALNQQADPGNGPANCLLVPNSTHPQVHQWDHSSLFTCHPGPKNSLLTLAVLVAN